MSVRPRRRLRVAVVSAASRWSSEVSLVSAKAIMRALDPKRYELVRSASRSGGGGSPREIISCCRPTVGGGLVPLGGGRKPRGLARVGGHLRGRGDRGRIDVVFPVVHGKGARTGRCRGCSSSRGSRTSGRRGRVGRRNGQALMKTIFRQAGLPIVDHRVIRRETCAGTRRERARGEEAFGYPCFVKPSNGGSSVGITKAKDRPASGASRPGGAPYDRKIIVERGVEAGRSSAACSATSRRRRRCRARSPGDEFYDYAQVHRPRVASGDPGELSDGRQPGPATCGAGLSGPRPGGHGARRFLLDRGTESNLHQRGHTLPGFTPISMYPKLWEASGLPFRAGRSSDQLAFDAPRRRQAPVDELRPEKNGRGAHRLDKKRAGSNFVMHRSGPGRRGDWESSRYA